MPVWRGKGAQALRDKFAQLEVMNCMIAYPDGTGNCYTALPSHEEFRAAVHKCLLHCYHPKTPESEREDAAFLEQLYGTCSPYIDVDLVESSPTPKVLQLLDRKIKHLDMQGCAVAGAEELQKATILVGTRAKGDAGYKVSRHYTFADAPRTEQVKRHSLKVSVRGITEGRPRGPQTSRRAATAARCVPSRTRSDQAAEQETAR
eukprot:COSAG06_NODE_16439_length_1001_cov_2.678492_1_plen_204_part_00